jgi:acetyltransferase
MQHPADEMKSVAHVTWMSRDGTPVVIRPITNADGASLKAFFQHVEPRDMRLKFFGAINIEEKAITHMLDTGDLNTVIFVAVSPANGEMLGFAKWTKDSDTAEFAILVRSDLQNHGFGWLLMKAIISYSVFRGIREIRGDVLASNANMLGMCRELGFVVSHSLSDPQCVSINLDLRKRSHPDDARGM